MALLETRSLKKAYNGRTVVNGVDITINPGEILFHLRAAGWKIRPTTDEEYNFNFTPPIRSQTNADLIVMFLKCGINFYTPSPRDNAQMYGAGF